MTRFLLYGGEYVVMAGEGADALVVGSEEPALAVVLQAERGEGGAGDAGAHQGHPKAGQVGRIPKYWNDHNVPLEEVCSGL